MYITIKSTNIWKYNIFDLSPFYSVPILCINWLQNYSLGIYKSAYLKEAAPEYRNTACSVEVHELEDVRPALSDHGHAKEEEKGA